ncbi:hypothetical protein [Ornithinimicrobium kibberense]
MSAIPGPQSGDPARADALMTVNARPEWDEARSVLVHVSQVLPRVRWELSRMRLDVLDAHLRLARLAAPRLSGGRGAPAAERGVLLRGIVVSCEQGAAAGAQVDRKLQDGIAGLKAAAVLAGAGRAVGTHEELAQVRLLRDLEDLRTQLGATGTTLAGSATSLREVADRARTVSLTIAGNGDGVGDGRTVQRLHGMVQAAANQARYGDQDLDRAQARTSELVTQVRAQARDSGLRTRALRHDVGPPAPSNGTPR